MEYLIPDIPEMPVDEACTRLKTIFISFEKYYRTELENNYETAYELCKYLRAVKQAIHALTAEPRIIRKPDKSEFRRMAIELGYERVVHGHWVKPTVIDGRGFNIPHCSICNGVPCGVDEHTNYCPNCGAKMDEVSV